MEFGLSLFTSDRGIKPHEAAAAAESAGFTTFYVPEHSHIPANRGTDHPETGDSSLPDDRYMRTLDPWVSLAMAAAVTSTIRLGTAVALPLQSDPITLAKTVASLDHLSGGRVDFGIGFGWNLEEMADHGIPVGKRRAVLAEYLDLMRSLWTQEVASYSGEFVNLSPSWAWPKPVQAPHPPVLVGAFGNEKLFRWIARSADGWITTPIETGIGDSVTLLRRLWREEGRTGSPRIVVLHRGGGADRFGEFRDQGVDEILLPTPDVPRDQALGAIADYASVIEQYTS